MMKIYGLCLVVVAGIVSIPFLVKGPESPAARTRFQISAVSAAIAHYKIRVWPFS